MVLRQSATVSATSKCSRTLSLGVVKTNKNRLVIDL